MDCFSPPAAFIREGDWNQPEIVARGPIILDILNGQLMAFLVDDDPASSNNVPGKSKAHPAKSPSGTFGSRSSIDLEGLGGPKLPSHRHCQWATDLQR
jgi:hypothetical protein